LRVALPVTSHVFLQKRLLARAVGGEDKNERLKRSV